MAIPPFRRRSSRMTKIKAAIAKFLVGKLGLYQHQAAALLGVNQGRISEVMSGKRYKEVKPVDRLDTDQLDMGF